MHHKRRLIPGFTKTYNVDHLVYFERLPDMDAAHQRKRQLQGLSRAEQDTPVHAANPGRHAGLIQSHDRVSGRCLYKI